MPSVPGVIENGFHAWFVTHHEGRRVAFGGNDNTNQDETYLLNFEQTTPYIRSSERPLLRLRDTQLLETAPGYCRAIANAFSWLLTALDGDYPAWLVFVRTQNESWFIGVGMAHINYITNSTNRIMRPTHEMDQVRPGVLAGYNHYNNLQRIRMKKAAAAKNKPPERRPDGSRIFRARRSGFTRRGFGSTGPPPPLHIPPAPLPPVMEEDEPAEVKPQPAAPRHSRKRSAAEPAERKPARKRSAPEPAEKKPSRTRRKPTGRPPARKRSITDVYPSQKESKNPPSKHPRGY